MSAATPPPLPVPNADTQPFWDACARNELCLQRCDDCQAFRFYPGPLCPSCGSASHTWQVTDGRGEVYSFVVVRRAMHPAFVGDIPYAVALVELAETGGVRLPARIVDCPVDEVSIGMAVAVRFNSLSEGLTVPVFEPATTEDHRPTARSHTGTQTGP